MELRDYLKVFNKGKLVIIFGTILFVVIAVILTLTGKPMYETDTIVTVDRTNVIDQSKANYYLYDEYYSIQSNGLFSNTVANLLQSPSVVEDIYTKAHVDLPAVRSTSQLTKLFTVKLLPPASFNVSDRSTDPDQSKSLLNSTIQELQDRTNDLNVVRNGSKFILTATTPVSVPIKPFWALNIALSILIGLFVTSFILLFRNYVSQDK